MSFPRWWVPRNERWRVPPPEAEACNEYDDRQLAGYGTWIPVAVVNDRARRHRQQGDLS